MTPYPVRIRPYRRAVVRRVDPRLVTPFFDSPQDPECRRHAGQGISEVMARPTWWPLLRADLLAVAAVVNWGLSYGLTKLALAQWRPLTFTGTRFVAMALIAATVLKTQGDCACSWDPTVAASLLGGLLGFTLYQPRLRPRPRPHVGTVLDATAGYHSPLLAALPLARRCRARPWTPVGGRRSGHRRCRSPGPGQGQRAAAGRCPAGRWAQPRRGRQLCALRHRDAAARRAIPRVHGAGGLAPDRQPPLIPLALLESPPQRLGGHRALGLRDLALLGRRPRVPGLYVVDGRPHRARCGRHRAVRPAGSARGRDDCGRRAGRAAHPAAGSGSALILPASRSVATWLPRLPRRRR